jgi:hypothetical protein
MTTSLGPSPVNSIPPTLVEQLVDALGAAEARCAEQRIKIYPVTCQPSLRAAAPYLPPSYVNAETAPFLVHVGAPDGGAAAGPVPDMLDLNMPDLDQSASHLPAFDRPLAMVRPGPVDPVAGWAGASAVDRSGEPIDRWPEHDEPSDLPRFFDPIRAVPRQVPAAPQPTPPLSAATMAVGFGIGLALILPAMLFANLDKLSVAAQRADATVTSLTSGQITGSVVQASAFEIAERGAKAPTAVERLEQAEAAFIAAGRLIADGDYVGARDQLRQAILLGEDRARAWLDALQ